MGKQKVMVRVTLRDAKKRTKAHRIAVGLPGVMSAAVEDDMIIVVGDGVDSVTLTVMLRKHMGFAELHRVAPYQEGEDKKGGSKEGLGKNNTQGFSNQGNLSYPTYVYPPSSYQIHDPCYNQSCCIM